MITYAYRHARKTDGYYVVIYDCGAKRWVADVGPYPTAADRDAASIEITETGMILVDGTPSPPQLHLKRRYA